MRDTIEREKEVSLTTACFRLGSGYHAGRDRVLRGIWKGRQDERGRIWVSEAFVREAERQRAKGAPSTRTAAA